MKYKHRVMITLGTFVCISQLVGCAAMSSTDMMDLLDSGSDVEITMAVPAFSEGVVEAPEQAYTWEQLDQLKTYDVEFRVGFDKLFNINRVTEAGKDGKSGCMYINEAGERDGNTSFSDSLRNKPFMTKYMADTAITTKLSELGSKVYVDIEVGSGESVYASLNAYYNLFNEIKDEGIYFNANQSLTREDFYSLVYRVNNGVSDLEENTAFNNEVGGKGGNNIFASQVDKYAWLNTENNGLRPGNYKSSITRAEAVYMLMNYYFSNDLSNISINNIDLADAKDGGDMLTIGRDKLKEVNKETKETHIADGWQLGVLAKMQLGTKGYVHTDIYKALGLANQLGIIPAETDWNGAMTKVDAIDMVVKIHQVLNEREGYLTKSEYGTMKGNPRVEEKAVESLPDTKAEEGKAVEGKATEGKATESKPAESKPAESKPAESKHATTAPKPATPAPKPATPAPKPATPAPKPATPAPKPATPAPKPATPAPKPATPAPKPVETPPANSTGNAADPLQGRPGSENIDRSKGGGSAIREDAGLN